MRLAPSTDVSDKRRDRPGSGHTTAERRTGLAVIVLAAAMVARATLIPRPPAAGAFVAWCFLCDPHAGIDVLLNLPLFVPLGLGLRLAGLSRRRTLILVVATTVSIEMLQWLVITGREASVGDIMSNSLGGASGLVIAERWRTLVGPSPPTARRLACVAALAWLGVLAATAWLMRPSLPHTTYYGQIAADLAQFDRFTGVVIATTIGGASVGRGRIEDSEAIRERLRRDCSRVEAVVTPGAPTPRIAPILSIFDDRQREILLLGDAQRTAVFRLRRNATAARLNTPTIFLRGAVPPAGDTGAQTDTVRLAAWTERYRMYISARSRQATSGLMIELRPTIGWALLIPFEHTLAPQRANRFTSIWLALLIAPAGYWAARGARRGSRRTAGPSARARFLVMLAEWLAAPAMVAAILAAGLVALPLSLGLPAAYPWELAGVGAGLALGCVAGLTSRWVR